MTDDEVNERRAAMFEAIRDFATALTVLVQLGTVALKAELDAKKADAAKTPRKA